MSSSMNNIHHNDYDQDIFERLCSITAQRCSFCRTLFVHYMYIRRMNYQLRARRVLMLFNDVLLRTRRGYHCTKYMAL